MIAERRPSEAADDGHALKKRKGADGKPSPTEGKTAPHKSFVRPGALARYVDAQKKMSHVKISSSAVGRKRVAAETMDMASISPLKHGLTSIFTQRKRRLHKALLKLRIPRSPSPPGDNDAGLVALPTDLLMRVLCTLKHCELPPLFTVCKRLHDAATAAMALHFNFLTPARDGRQADIEPAQWLGLSPAAVAAVAEKAPPAPQRRGPRRRRPAPARPPTGRQYHKDPKVVAKLAKHKAERVLERDATVKSLSFEGGDESTQQT